MQPTAPSLPRHVLRTLHDGLAAADDAQIAKVVAMVDALEKRGAADDVIAPLRPRLAQLQPRRPLRFSRLLFLPLDPLIVPAAEWRASDATIPRTALLPLSEMVHAALGNEAVAIDSAIRGHFADEGDVVAAAGARLWPAAGAVLAGASDPPAGWAKAGLPATGGTSLVRHIGGLLGLAQAPHGLFAEIEIGVVLPAEALAPLVAVAAAGSADMLAMLAALVLARLPDAHRLLVQAGRVLREYGEARVRSAIGRAIGILLRRLEMSSGIEAMVVGSDLSQAGAQVRRIAQLLDYLRENETGPDMQRRLATIAQRLDACCRLRFGAAMEMEFATVLQSLGQDATPVDLDRLEDAARGLHDLKREARQIGSPELYDMLLQQAAARVKAPPADGALSLVDRVRLVEILVGPDEALAMLEAELPADAETA